MESELLSTLPLAQRLALSYAPGRSRGTILSLFALDSRLAKIVRQGGEPIIAQMKLAWWRDRFKEDASRWPEGEPLLARLRDWPRSHDALAPMVDGWEALLGEALDDAAAFTFAAGRGESWSGCAATLGKGDRSIIEQAMQAGREWALADLALRCSDPAERQAMRALALGEPWRNPRLPRCLRPFAVLHRLAGRTLERNADDVLDGPGAALAAMRVGLIGR